MTNNIVSLSGGKDSTAMLHMMLERGEDIHSVVFLDTGWEFPEMLEHIDLVEEKTGLKVVRLKPERSFNYWMYEREVRAKEGVFAGEVWRIGGGWPSTVRRWCTREKVKVLRKYIQGVDGAVSCVGFAFDEQHRPKDNAGFMKRYPLIEYKVTEEQALKYCFNLGYTWGGLYEWSSRVSCWCCPLQGIKGVRKLRRHRPELWRKLIDMDLRQPRHNPGFLETHTALELEARFREEDKQMKLF